MRALLLACLLTVGCSTPQATVRSTARTATLAALVSQKADAIQTAKIRSIAVTVQGLGAVQDFETIRGLVTQAVVEQFDDPQDRAAALLVVDSIAELIVAYLADEQVQVPADDLIVAGAEGVVSACDHYIEFVLEADDGEVRARVVVASAGRLHHDPMARSAQP